MEKLTEKDIYKLTYLERLDLKNTPIEKEYGVSFKIEILIWCYEFMPFLTFINGSRINNNDLEDMKNAI